MPPSNRLTLENCALLLQRRGVISPEQQKDILSRGKAQESKLFAYYQAGASRRVQHGAEAISPVEVIASFNLELSGSPGKFLTEDLITEVVASAVGLPYLRIDPLKLDLNVVTAHIPRPFALKNLIVAVAEDKGVITVAVADPFNDTMVKELAAARRLEIRRVLSSKSDILKILREFYGFRASVMAAEAEASSGVELGNLEQFFKLKGHHDIEGNDKHVVDAVDFLLQYAFDQNASDIHIEPKREKSLIRFRIDGVMHNIHVIPKPLHAPIVSRIKMLSRMDLAEKRRPQDGRIKTSSNNKDVELRVSTVPVAFGEKVVIRVFDPDILLQDLDSMGFYPRELALYNAFIRRPNGIILVTGPTGSGKTTTLYSSLRSLSSPEVNIITVEDPIEMVMEEFNQIGVQQAIGVGFDSILRNILRQDPDIIMIGEIRDRETAENAVQAALTGHLVLSTLHTNDSASAIIRLLDLGVPPFLISATVIGIVAQRLLRRICPHCKSARELTHDERTYLQLGKKASRVWEGGGCKECRSTGYKGRTGIFEVLDMSERVKSLITGSVELGDLLAAAREEGLASLRQIAIQKMLEGVTTYEEVVAMTG
ncbi:type II/IV secretion system protein [Oryzomonas japonica]|uniref:Type II/IV secretion system protein n=1 Tax=Oryzomonas japonica TaxID=2603858 RepID=A0A7J4ZSG0_9BACT|nr:GspE/PulE family protein [Oryzomonas japonica]KAB0666246.1 type II/IV secretion system protein [Oryzomonas japonica]